MELSIVEQAKSLIEKSKKILLIAHAKMDGDTLSATIAMHLILQKLGKKTTVACSDPVPEIFSFLPETGAMEREISAGNDFVIALDCSQTQAKRLRWKIEGNKLKIFVTPFGGKFNEREVSFSEQSDFDLIITLDAADRRQLGSIFDENTELFARVPIVVFDHHASNPGFGTVNVIETKAASTTEVIFNFLPVLFGQQWKKKLDTDIATLLLTGIITDTASFQNPNTTPKSLEVAADLVELGARQQEIIRHVFKTKNIPTLKLWGRVLSKIKTDPMHRMLWSTVSADDLADTGGTLDDMNGIIDELLATAPGMEMVLLIKERDDGVVSISIRTTTPLCNAAEFSQEFGGGGHIQAAGFKIRANRPFDVIVGEVIDAAQNFQKRRFGLESPENSEESGEENLLPEVEPERSVASALDVAREQTTEETAPLDESASVAESTSVDEEQTTWTDQGEQRSGEERDTQEQAQVFEEEAGDLSDENNPLSDEKTEAQVPDYSPEEREVSLPAEADASQEAAAPESNLEESSSEPDQAAQDFTHEEFSGMLESIMRRDPLDQNKQNDTDSSSP